MSRRRRRNARTWTELGATNPFWGVLTGEAYDGVVGAEHVPEEFWVSGERHVDRVVATIARLDPAFEPTSVVDFGCGVGRMLVPFARRFEQVRGVDLSPTMRAVAGQRLRECGLTNVSLSPDVLGLAAPPESVDLVHSALVLQHIPPRDGEAIVGELVDLVRPGGWAVLHVYLGARASRWRQAIRTARGRSPLLDSVLGRVPGRARQVPYEMNPYDLRRLAVALAERGLDAFWVEVDAGAESLDATLFVPKPLDG